MVTNNYTYPTKMVYPKPIVVYKQCHGDPQKQIATMFGLRVSDFIWISTSHGWPGRLSGNSRSTLVLDQLNTVSHPKDDRIRIFSTAVLVSFDRVVSAPNCQSALKGWLRDKNPEMYRRMIGEDINNVHRE